jgi:fidgetin-like protein 1
MYATRQNKGNTGALFSSSNGSGGNAQKRPRADGGGKDSRSESPLPPELEHCEKALVEKIESEIVQRGQPVVFDDIAGLEFAKKCVNELICWPMSRPDLFQGLRALPKGLLLFGPPGTGQSVCTIHCTACSEKDVHNPHRKYHSRHSSL